MSIQALTLSWRRVEQTWSSWVGAKRDRIKRAERLFPLQKTLLLHHGYQSLIFDFSWPFFIKKHDSHCKSDRPGRWEHINPHTPPHREVRTLLTRVCRPNSSLHLTWHFQLHVCSGSCVVSHLQPLQYALLNAAGLKWDPKGEAELRVGGVWCLGGRALS